MPDFNVTDVVLIIPAVFLNIYFWRREFRKRKPEHYPTKELRQSAQMVKSFKDSFWMFGALSLIAVLYMAYAYVIFQILPPPLFFG